MVPAGGWSTAALPHAMPIVALTAQRANPNDMQSRGGDGSSGAGGLAGACSDSSAKGRGGEMEGEARLDGVRSGLNRRSGSGGVT